MMASCNGHNNLPYFSTKDLQIEKILVRNEMTDQLQKPLSSEVDVKTRMNIFYVHLDFEKGLTIDALGYSESYVNGVEETNVDRIEEQSSTNVFKNDHLPGFKCKMANGQAEKTTATVILKDDIADHIFSERLVVMKNVTELFSVSHNMRHSSIVINTKQSLFHFFSGTRLAKNANIEKRAQSKTFRSDDNVKCPPVNLESIAFFTEQPSKWKKSDVTVCTNSHDQQVCCSLIQCQPCS